MSVLRVVVVRTGGFAGVTRTAEVDDPGEAARLSEAVRSSADRTPDDRVRDDFSYEFTIVTSTAVETVGLAASQLTPALRALLPGRG